MSTIILGVDQGVCSGYASIYPGRRKPFLWGEAKTSDHRALFFAATLTSRHPAREAWMVIENHRNMPLVRGTRHDRTSRESGKAGTRSMASILGQGENAGRWLEQAELRGVPKSHILRVAPSDWRRALLGSRWASAKQDAVREESVRWASALLGEVVGHDCAAAVAIAVYAANEMGLEPGKVAG